MLAVGAGPAIPKLEQWRRGAALEQPRYESLLHTHTYARKAARTVEKKAAQAVVVLL